MLRRPDGLTKSEIAFWLRHAKRCEADGSLSIATVDSFLLLCRTAGLLRDLNVDPTCKEDVTKYVHLSKIYERQAIPFGIARSPNRPPVQKEESISDILKGLSNHAEENEDGEETEVNNE
jgi:hypothetical protein